jgi:hypothetical protein
MRLKHGFAGAGHNLQQKQAGLMGTWFIIYHLEFQNKKSSC